MRWRDVLEEARRNVSSGATRAAVGACALLAILVGTVLLDGLAMANVFASQRAVADGGGATHVVAAAGAVDGERCLALRNLPGVVGVIALREAPHRLPLITHPHSKPALFDVAGDVAGVLGGTRRGTSGIWLSQALAARVGSGPLPLADGRDAAVLGTFPYPEDGRNSQLALAALAPVTPDGTFDACWLKVWPHQDASVALLDSALEPGAAEATRAVLNLTFGEPRATADLLRERPTRALLALGVAASAALGGGLVWLRRVELGLALHLGVRAYALRTQMVVETMCWGGPATALGIAASVAASARQVFAQEAAWLAGNVALAATALMMSAVAGALTASILIREHRLFAWAKDR